MLEAITTFIKKKFATFCAVLLVPTTGVWFTYWERDQSYRESVRAQLEAESNKHKSFIDEVSAHLVSGDFKYLDVWDDLDRVGFKSVIEGEAKRLNRPVPDLESLSSSNDRNLPPGLPANTLSEIFGAKLNLLLESLRSVEPIAEQQGKPTKLTRETLHFLRRTGLLGYGGLFNTEADLTNLDLREINIPCTSLYQLRIKDTNFKNANLAAVYLSSAGDFRNVDFTGATLSYAWLGKSRIIESRFDSATLWETSLKEAALKNSSFDHADMKEANLYGAIILEGNTFKNSDLRGALLLFNHKKSINGKIFDGAYGNSKPVRLKNGAIIAPTILPKGYTFEDLGLIDLSNDKTKPMFGLPRQDEEEKPTIFLPDQCRWKVDGNYALIQIYRGLTEYVP